MVSPEGGTVADCARRTLSPAVQMPGLLDVLEPWWLIWSPLRPAQSLSIVAQPPMMPFTIAGGLTKLTCDPEPRVNCSVAPASRCSAEKRTPRLVAHFTWFAFSFAFISATSSIGAGREGVPWTEKV